MRGTPRPAWSIPRFPCSPLPISACFATSRSRMASVEVAITPTYSGCPAMNMIDARDRTGAGARGFSQFEGAHRAVAGLDHRLDERRRPPQAPGIRHRAAAGRRAPAARCSACSRWRARNAAPTIPRCCPNSARPPARRCGAARAAANRSIISSVTESALTSLRAKRSNPSLRAKKMDCFVASLLAMTLID